MAALEPLMSMIRFGEGVGRHNDGTDLALINEPTDLGELPAIGSGSVTDTVRSMLHRRFSRGLAECGDENAARLQHRPGPFLGFSPDEVEDQINFTRDFLETLRLVVDSAIGAEFADKVEVLG